MKTSLAPSDPTASALLDVRTVAELIGCSTRNVFRLAEAGKMPARVKIGHLVRWRRSDLEEWIATSCPAMEVT